MRKLLVVVPVGLAVLAAILFFSTTRSASETSEARLARARLKRDFGERAGGVRGMPPEQLPQWQAEVAALSRWYFEELSAIKNRFPGEAPRKTGVQAAEEEKKGKLKNQERDALADFQGYAEGRLVLLREAKYAPVASAVTEGLRLDLVAVEPGAPPGGGAPQLRIDFALWGAPRYLERERAGDKNVTRTSVPVAFRRLNFQFLDAQGKPWGTIEGGGEPYQKLSDPERFVDDFPSGVLFGTWWIDSLFPREAASLTLEVAVDLRGPSGATRPATFTFSRLPVPERWKLAPGATFQAEVREAPPPGR
jgi:hypothetical protein